MSNYFGRSHPSKCSGCRYLMSTVKYRTEKVFDGYKQQSIGGGQYPVYKEVKKKDGLDYKCTYRGYGCYKDEQAQKQRSSSSSGSRTTTTASKPSAPAKRNGYYVVNYTDGSRYEGNFVDDIKSGFGKCVYSNGCFYEGEWKNGKKNGKGYETYNGGASYDGDFKDDKRCGYGVFKYPSGNVYEGEFQNDLRCGWGKLTYPDGHYSMCMYKDDKQNGSGVITNNSGDILYVDFKDNRMEGWGICILKDGTKKSSYYENNERTKYMDFEPGLYEPSSIPDLSTIRKRYHPGNQSSAPAESTVRTVSTPKPAGTAPAPKPTASGTANGHKPAKSQSVETKFIDRFVAAIIIIMAVATAVEIYLEFTAYESWRIKLYISSIGMMLVSIFIGINYIRKQLLNSLAILLGIVNLLFAIFQVGRAVVGFFK